MQLPTSTSCPWYWAASPQLLSSMTLTLKQLSMPPSSVSSHLTVSVAPLAHASWFSAASTTSSWSATQRRLSASRLVCHPIRRPRSAHWFTQSTTTRSPPTSRLVSKKPSWLLVASVQKSSQRATSSSPPSSSTWTQKHASSRKKSSALS